MRRAVPLLALLLALPAAACGGGDDGGGDDDDPVDIDAEPEPDSDPSAPDAMGLADGPPAEVVEVVCPGTVAVEVTATDGTFRFDGVDPMGNPDSHTIQVNDIVRFSMPGSHSAVSGQPGAADGKFLVTGGSTLCLRFVEAGTYPFFCNPHQFPAQIVVEP